MSLNLENNEKINFSEEIFKIGKISEIESLDLPIELISKDLAPLSINKVKVSDPYVERYSSEEISEVRNIEQFVDNIARKRREIGKWERKASTVYFDENNEPQQKRGWGDPVSRSIFFNDILNNPAINAWRTKIPSAAALLDLSEPFSDGFITDRKGNEVLKDENTKKWLSLCIDAVAIRSRATVMASAVKEFIENNQFRNSSQTSNLRWMSIACGTALPAMKAAQSSGIQPELFLVDLDKNALKTTEQLAETIGFDGLLKQKDNINIFLANEMAQLRSELMQNGGRPLLIDLLGIFEYTGNNIGVDPIKFLRSNYDMLQPGGRLIFGQMRSDRPVPDFTMGVVSWPYIETRSLIDFLDIIKQADIPLKKTTLYLPDDGVYFVGVIDKPIASEKFLS